MIPILGQLLLHLALGSATVGVVVGCAAGLRGSARAFAMARWVAILSAGALVLATGLLEYALIAHDFSVSYVAQVGSRSTPPIISAVSLWSSLDGSMLFWAVVLGVYTAVFAHRVRRGDATLGGWAVATLLGVQVFFGVLVVAAAPPFAAMDPVPADGPGPNALLQNHLLMAIHPPTLYLGYVGMAVPFAMGVAALLAGRLDAAWLRSMRAWSLWVWSFLTLGIVLGGWWSYEVLGWGGYWAWDPVENASLLPWLTLTAFLHSLIVTERRRMFRGWTIVLVLVSFLLVMLGTFMTRSGVFNSVHSFTQSAIGPLFLGFVALILLGSVVLLAFRLDALADPHERPFAVVSREAGFLLNNLALTVFTFIVLFGTLYPLLNQALTGEQVSVGEPYYERVVVPLAVALLFLMGVGPALPWGRTDARTAARELWLPTAIGIGAAAAAVVLGATGGWEVATWAFAGFAVVVSARELWTPIRVRIRAGRQPPIRAALGAVARSRRRVGAHLAHVGVAVAAVAIAASSVHRVEGEVSLEPKQTVEWEGYLLTYLGNEVVDQTYRVSQRASFAVKRGDQLLGTLVPSMNHYRNRSQPLGTPAVHNGLREDLYLSMLRIDRSTGAVALRVYRQPLVVWLWVGGLLMVVGGLVAAWPRRRRAREVAS